MHQIIKHIPTVHHRTTAASTSAIAGSCGFSISGPRSIECGGGPIVLADEGGRERRRTAPLLPQQHVVKDTSAMLLVRLSRVMLTSSSSTSSVHVGRQRLLLRVVWISLDLHIVVIVQLKVSQHARLAVMEGRWREEKAWDFDPRDHLIELQGRKWRRREEGGGGGRRRRKRWGEGGHDCQLMPFDDELGESPWELTFVGCPSSSLAVYPCWCGW